MRSAFIYALVFATTLHASGASLSSVKDLKVKNDAWTSDLTGEDGGRMLRRVEKGDNYRDEERGLIFQELLAKFNPAQAAKKAANAEKIRNTLKNEGEFQNWLALQALKNENSVK
ncbi:hypothetical protein ON010_g13138 [Phytophthora cinnamomi]|nr:hypothetical protein ON010_g13138 [Phytophthora cinnamomi]